MPQRPRQHATETASRRAFERWLPAEWVYRPQPDDYGIDGEVEVFSEGRATGLIFKVQLKGSDQQDAPQTVRLTKDKVNYYSALPVLVLVVLHHGQTDRLFACWTQSWDPAEEYSSADSITMRFSEEHELSEESAVRLANDVEMFRRLRDSNHAFPIRFSIARSAESVGEVPTSTISLALREASTDVPDVIEVVTAGSENEMAEVHLKPDRIVVTCRGLVSATVHYPPEGSGQTSAELVHNTLVQFGLVLMRLGHPAPAARLFTLFASGSSIVDEFDVLVKVAQSFGRTHRLDDAIDVADDLIEHDRDDTAQLLLSLTWTALGSGITTGEREMIVEHLGQRARQVEEEGDPKRAGVEYFNLANRLRVLGRAEDAVTYYRKAADLDPSYTGRDYYAGEFAGALFEAGDYEGAAEMYGRAVNGRERARFLPLHADALLMSGRYREAERTFANRQPRAGVEPGEWQLKQQLAGHLAQRLGDVQHRDMNQANQLADVSASDLTNEEVRIRLDEALAADGLCGLAWFNLGVLELNEGNQDAALDAFTSAGLVTRIDLEAWALATILSFHHQSPDANAIVRVAYFFNGASYIRYLSERTETPELQEARGDILDFVESVLDAGPIPAPESETLRMRFIDETGNYESLDVEMS